MVRKHTFGLALVLLGAWGYGPLAAQVAPPEKPASPAESPGQLPADAPGTHVAPAAPDPATADVPSRAQRPKKKESDFVRLRRGEKGEPLALETSVVSYVSADGKQQVDLVGAIHVGELGYYQDLNETFKAYDALLYELVAPEKSVPKPGASDGSPVSSVQTGLKSLLKLEFQLDVVDYTAKNFVHADMTPEEFSRSMTDKGESVWKLMFRLWGQGIAQQATSENQTSDVDLLLAFFSRDRALKMKRIMAEQMVDLEASASAIDGAEGSTILRERNGKAFAVLDRELAAGRNKLGVFYGAAHLPDMDRRLREKGFTPTGSKWFVAWKLDQ